MRGPVVDQLVHGFMFSKPKSNDPPNFQALLQRQLIPEVRLETQAFYGHLSSQEAKYPGLDYSYQPHRVRLSRYPWHRRLFRAFDSLGLTKSEIAGLTQWEGTRWAKERYEREQGILIQDTTSEDISNWVEPELRVAAPVTGSEVSDNTGDMELDGQIAPEREQNGGEEVDAQMNEEEESDSDIPSVGVALNERLRAVVAQREAGNPSPVMDEEWEQWFKDAVEAGGLPFLSADFSPHANVPGTRPATDPQTSLFPPEVINSARLDSRQRITNPMHGVVRYSIDGTNISSSNDSTRRMWDPSGSAQQSSLRPLNTSSLSRDATSSSLSSPSILPPSRRSNINTMAGMNSRMRHWDIQHTSRGTSGARFAHLSSIRATQNSRNGSIS